MMLILLVLLPALGGTAAFLTRRKRTRRALLVATAVGHAGLTANCWLWRPDAILDGWLRLDALGLVFLSLVSGLFLAASAYAVSYLAREEQGVRPDFQERIFFVNEPEAVFVGCLLLFLATMTLVTLSHHFGLLWVAVEATTLASAPLIYFHRHHRSLEATWKYLIICSVGIALALLGTFFLAFAAAGGTPPGISLVVGDLISHAPILRLPWLKVAFLFLLVGYGTKMGLAPLHSWLPDAHSEAPSVISALLSGALLNCAFLGILRITQVLGAAGAGEFSGDLLLAFGLLSIAFAAVFIVGQLDYKRLLAYSSIEHMGIMAVGIGLGGLGSFGAMLHAVNHSLTKGMLFLVAGNILSRYRTKSSNLIAGMRVDLPRSALLWLAGLFAVTGTPPFGLFQSELTIIRRALQTGHLGAVIIVLAVLAAIFVAMSVVFVGMAQGAGRQDGVLSEPEPWGSILPPALLCVVVLVLGLYVPRFLSELLQEAALLVGGSA